MPVRAADDSESVAPANPVAGARIGKRGEDDGVSDETQNRRPREPTERYGEEKLDRLREPALARYRKIHDVVRNLVGFAEDRAHQRLIALGDRRREEERDVVEAQVLSFVSR